jgi:hypothetical protein
MRHQPAVVICLAGFLAAPAAVAAPISFEEQRLLMRQVTQQLQARLEKRLRCFNQAKNLNDLDGCQRTTSTGWHHGPGMGVWGCPMW